MQILQEDVQTLKSGMKTVHLEMKKEPNNFIIFISSLIILSYAHLHSRVYTGIDQNDFPSLALGLAISYGSRVMYLDPSVHLLQSGSQEGPARGRVFCQDGGCLP